MLPCLPLSPLFSPCPRPPRRSPVPPPARRASLTPTAATMTPTPTTTDTNPLLTYEPFPLFDQVTAEHVVPGVRAVLAELSAEIDALEAAVTRTPATWETLVVPLERIADRIARCWGTVNHLKSVKDTEAFRKAVEEVQPERVELSLRLSQSRPLYEAFKSLRDGASWSSLTESQQRIVDGELRDFVNGGVALEGAEKERFNAIQKELSKLSTTFSNHVLDATKAVKRLCTDPASVDGLPASAKGLAAQTARANGHPDATPEEGPWMLTLDIPSFMPVLTHCKNR